jgi:hypothetical protein
MRPGIVACALALAVVSCAPMERPYADLPRLSLQTRFTPNNYCTGSESPPLLLSPMPRGATQATIRMSNVSVLRQQPQEWNVTFGSGIQRIPEGALKGYVGPCLGETQRFTYRIEFLARNTSGEPLAYGTTSVRAEPVYDAAQKTWRTALQQKQDDDWDEDDPYVRTLRRDSDASREVRDREFGLPPVPNFGR